MRAREETDLDFFSRRAIEEARSAAISECARASAAHRRMAAVYAGRLRDEQSAEENFAALLVDIDLADGDPPPDDGDADAT